MGTAIDDVAWGVGEILGTLFTNPDDAGTKQAGFTIIKKIQSGVINWNNHTTTNTSRQTVCVDATISVSGINPDKTIVLLNSSISQLDTSQGSGGNYSYTECWQSYLVSKSSSSVVISPNWGRKYFGNDNYSDNRLNTIIGKTSYQIIEFY